MRWRICIISYFVSLFFLSTCFTNEASTQTSGKYCFVLFDTKQVRFYLNDHHFMSLLTDNGAFVFRPHPGKDINGWGSSWYAQPFLPGAALSHTVIDTVRATDAGIYVAAHGKVSRGADSTYGHWQMKISFRYDSTAKEIHATGIYSIQLDDFLTHETGDLNLYKIASNYLHNVPLLQDGVGDTGDMDSVYVSGKNMRSFSWHPPRIPAHFPTDLTDSLSIDVSGQFNNVDTKAMGDSAIAAAYKPSIKVVLSLKNNSPARMQFGAIYDTAKAKLFYADNVGITPLIKNRSEKNFQFDVQFESKALPGDGSIADTTVTVRPQDCQDIYICPISDVKIFSSKNAKMFQLYQNYPNPFNPTTIVTYTISKVGNVELTVYNQLGQKITTLRNAKQSPGAYQIQWDGKDSEAKVVASGIYHFRLRVDGFTQTRKMLLLR